MRMDPMIMSGMRRLKEIQQRISCLPLSRIKSSAIYEQLLKSPSDQSLRAELVQVSDIFKQIVTQGVRSVHCPALLTFGQNPFYSKAERVDCFPSNRKSRFQGYGHHHDLSLPVRIDMRIASLEVGTSVNRQH